MKILRLILPFLFAAFIPLAAIAQTPQLVYNGQFSGTGGTVLSGATLTWASGSSLQLQFGTVGANRLVIETNSSGLVGTVGLGAGLSISGGNLVAGSSSSANPTASVGLSAVNGTATTYMTSDSAPALSQAIVPTWTGLHKFSITSAITSGSDFGIEIIPTLNQRNATNFSLIFGNETVTQAGTGTQDLIQLQIGGTNEWVVDSTGTVKTGIWGGTVIGSAFGGAGTINGPLSGNGSGVVALATGGTGIVVSSVGIAISSLVVTNVGASMPSNSLLLGNTSPDVKVANGLSTDGTSELLLGVAGTSIGKVNMTNATSGSVTLQPVTGALGSNVVSIPAATGTLQIFTGSSTSGDVAVFSNSTGSIQDLGVLGVAANTTTITTSSGSVVPLVIANAGVTSNAFSISSQQFAASMGTGNEFVMEIGVANTSLNTATIGFHYTGSGNAGNFISMGFNGANDEWEMDTTGTIKTAGLFAAAARTSGILPYFKLTIPTDTGLTAATEAPGFQTVTATRTWATTGTVTLQREYKFAAPTYASASASQTFTTAATLDITGAPIAGTNAIITNAYALNVESGISNFGGAVVMGSTLTVSGSSSFVGNAGFGGLPNSSYSAYFSGTVSGNAVAAFLIGNTTTATGNTQFQYGESFGLTENTGTFTGLIYHVIDIEPSTVSGSGTIATAAMIYIATGTTATTSYGIQQVGTNPDYWGGKFTAYNNIATSGWGIPAIYGSGRATAQVAANTSVATYTVGAADGTFEVSANILVTASVTNSFTCTCTYTDEGNTSRALTLSFSQISGVLVTTITNVTGTGAYEGVPLHIRCKASTAITIATVGTFTSVTYNCEGIIKQES